MKFTQSTYWLLVFDKDENRGIIRESLGTTRRDVAIGRARRMIRSRGLFRRCGGRYPSCGEWYKRYDATIVHSLGVQGKEICEKL